MTMMRMQNAAFAGDRSTEPNVSLAALSQRHTLTKTLEAMCKSHDGAGRLTALFEQASQYQSVLETALDVAFEHHAGQFRNDGSLYVTHPMKVAECVATWGGNADDIITAILHDVVEDSPAGFESTICAIGSTFGERVAWQVLALTKPSAISDKHARNKEAFNRVLSALAFGQTGVVAVKLADRLHNSCTSHGLSVGKRAQLDAENRAWYAPLAQRVGATSLANALLRSTSTLNSEQYLNIEPLTWLSTPIHENTL